MPCQILSFDCCLLLFFEFEFFGSTGRGDSGSVNGLVYGLMNYGLNQQATRVELTQSPLSLFGDSAGQYLPDTSNFWNLTDEVGTEADYVGSFISASDIRYQIDFNADPFDHLASIGAGNIITRSRLSNPGDSNSGSNVVPGVFSIATNQVPSSAPLVLMAAGLLCFMCRQKSAA